MEHLTPKQEEDNEHVKPKILVGLANAAITPEVGGAIMPLFQEQASTSIPRMGGIPVFGGYSVPRRLE